ncbi:MAG: hypothetical protein ACRDTH_11340 [Pseudonocardiaceae bacterium]
MRITDGHLAGFKGAIREAVEFVEQHGPQLMVQTFIDEQQMLAYSLQLYRDSESVLVHWRLSDPYISKVMEHCTVEKFDVYGQPSEEVRERLNQLGESLTTVTPRLVGFVRLPSGG